MYSMGESQVPALQKKGVKAAAKPTCGDKLSWLETAENYEKRVALRNEIKAG